MQNLTGMVRAILGARPHLALALDAQSAQGGLFDLASLLARVAAAGHSVKLEAWQSVPLPPRTSATKPARVKKMNVPLSGANYRAPFVEKPPRAAPALVMTAQAVAGTAPLSSTGIHEALRANQESLRALQAMQEQTARIHQAFLEGQLATQNAFQALLTGSPMPVVVAAPAFQPAPAVAVTRVAPASQPKAPPTRVEANIGSVVMAVVAEATGYPVETLAMTMELEADLGIDSIKRVEILSMLSKRIEGAPSVNPEKLGSLKTLQQVLDFVSASAAAPLAPTVILNDVSQVVLAVVSEATGYPLETLSLSMELEADLGIDSIKRVEILSMLSKRIEGAPSVNPEKLGSLKTLQHVLDFVSSASAAPAPVVAAPASVSQVVLAVVSEATGYPLETLSLAMELEAELGIDSIKRVEILSMLSKRIEGAPSVNPEKLGSLKTLQHIVDFVSLASPAQATNEIAAHVPALEPAKAGGQIDRRIVVPVRLNPGAPAAFPKGEMCVVDEGQSGLGRALVDAHQAAGHSARSISNAAEAPVYVGGLFVCSPSGVWSAASERSLKNALLLARALAPKLRERKGFFVAVSRRDGAFGHATSVAGELALHGGLAGLVKTASHEWSEVRCRAIDVASTLTLKESAAQIIQELGTEGPLEVGLGPAGRITLAMKAQPALPGVHGLGRGDVIVVTGGARGVTAECARTLAQRHGVSLLLLGRSPEPIAEVEWLTHAQDEAAIKRVILENAPAGQRPTPKQLGEASRAVLAA